MLKDITNRFKLQDNIEIIDLKEKVILRPWTEKQFFWLNVLPEKVKIKDICIPTLIELILLRIDDDKYCFTNFRSFFVYPKEIEDTELIEGGRYLAMAKEDLSYECGIKLYNVKIVQK